MSGLEAFIIITSGLLAGAINAVAGGGTFLTFPALIYAGISPIVANATSTIAVWPAAVASAVAYRHQLQAERKALLILALTSLLGGATGALILLLTPVQTFENLIPWLMLGGTLLFAFGDRLRREASEHQVGNFTSPLSIALQLGIALYGGYFGAGIGILMLALLTLLGLRDIHAMNALKTVLGSAINGIAVLVFVFSGLVDWRVGAILAVSAIIGGYFGARFALKLPKHWVRRFVLCIACAMTAWFFVKYYG